MTFQITTNTKWMMGVVAAFVVGAGTTAMLFPAPKAPAPVQDMAALAAQMNDIMPVAGDVAADTSKVVAKVNGGVITLDQVKTYAKSMPQQIANAPMEQVFPMVQEQMVMGEVISGQPGAKDLANDPEVQQRMATMRDNVIRATFLEREVAKRVNDSTLKKEYDAFVKGFQPVDEVSAQHILVDDEAKAKEIIAKIKAGGKFEDQVKEFSKDKGAAGNGDLGFFKQADMVKEFADAAFAMKKGELSKAPVKTQFGWHVIQVNDRRQSKAPGFEELQPQLKEKAQREAFEAILAELRKNANIELFDMNGNSLAKAAPAAAAAQPQAAQ